LVYIGLPDADNVGVNIDLSLLVVTISLSNANSTIYDVIGDPVLYQHLVVLHVLGLYISPFIVYGYKLFNTNII
jgi:hypothetical protein